MYCRKCGMQMPDDAVRCDNCGTQRIAGVTALTAADAADDSAVQNTPATVLENAQQEAGNLSEQFGEALQGANKKVLIGALIAVAALLFLLPNIAGKRCALDGCDEKTDGGRYCFSHACMVDGCNNAKSYYSIYCYYHTPVDESTLHNAEDDLYISSVYIDHGYSYTEVTGKVKNNGNYTYEFVQLKGVFQDSRGNVVDTDWTYLVGSEGIAPGETVTFKMYVDRNYSINQCKVTVIDWQ